MHRLATRIPLRGLDGKIYGALVPTTASILRLARERLIDGVLPGGSEWEIKGNMIRVYAKSYDPENETLDAVDYLRSLRRAFGRRRKLDHRISADIAEHRRKFVDLLAGNRRAA